MYVLVRLDACESANAAWLGTESFVPLDGASSGRSLNGGWSYSRGLHLLVVGGPDQLERI